VTCGFNVPCNLWDILEFSHQEVVTNHEVVDHIFETWACLIKGTPTSAGYFKLTILDQLSELVLGFIILSNIPHLKVFHLSKSESPVWVSDEFIHNSGKSNIDLAMLSHLVGTNIVLVNCLLETHVSPREWDQVNINCFILFSSLNQGSTFCMAWVLLLLSPSLPLLSKIVQVMFPLSTGLGPDLSLDLTLSLSCIVGVFVDLRLLLYIYIWIWLELKDLNILNMSLSVNFDSIYIVDDM